MTTQQVDPLRKCKDARDHLAAIRRDLAGMSKFFGVLGDRLGQDPIRLMLSNTGGTDFSAPMDIAMGRDVPSLDYSKWPSKEEVASKLKAYYDAEHAYRQAYHALPPGDQSLFQNRYP